MNTYITILINYNSKLGLLNENRYVKTDFQECSEFL